MFQEQSKALQESLIALAMKGYLVRPAVGSCQNCAGNLVRRAVEKAIEHEDRKAIRGVMFWSGQDEKDRVNWGSFYVAYGNIPMDHHNSVVIGDPAVQVGKTVYETLNEHGLKVVWNGEDSQRILVYEPGGVWYPQEPQIQCDGSGCVSPYLN